MARRGPQGRLTPLAASRYKRFMSQTTASTTATAQLRQSDLVDLNRTFEDRTPEELVRWAMEIFGDRLACLSAMQKAGNVLCHMLHAMQVPIDVLFVDTGVLFEETYITRDRIRDEYDLNIVTLQPDKSMAEQTAELGVLYLTVDGQKQCCDLRKTQPLLKVAGKYDALLGSLRRSDGGRRESCPILAVDPRMNCLRINPLVNMGSDEMRDYIERHDVIVNPLHAQGFPTVGCNRCTTPVLPDEPKRAGRWRHLGPWSVYCGINPTDLDPELSPFIELRRELVDRILGRATDFVI
jgi:phosphoadenosine phosphosulfate reductase